MTGDVTVERCACGGWINADYATPSDVQNKVQAHRATAGHRDWAAHQDWPANEAQELRDAEAEREFLKPIR